MRQLTEDEIAQGCKLDPYIGMRVKRLWPEVCLSFACMPRQAKLHGIALHCIALKLFVMLIFVSLSGKHCPKHVNNAMQLIVVVSWVIASCCCIAEVCYNLHARCVIVCT